MKKNFILFICMVAFLSAGLQTANAATKTWLPTTGGAWTTGGNWSPAGAPAGGDVVIINSDQSANITAVPTIALNSLSVSGTCTLVGAGGGAKTITIGGAAGTDFTVSIGKTLTLGTNLNITLAANATATIDGTLTVNTGRTFNTNGAGVVTTVTGAITCIGTVTCTTDAKLLFQSGSTYTHNRNGGTIPTATWNVSSTCQITGNTGTEPGGDGQAFGNLVYNCPGLGGSNLNMAASGLSIAGNFEVVDIGGGGQLRMVQTPVTVSGNCTISSGFRIASGTTRTLNVNGNFTMSGGTMTMSGGAGVGTLNVPHDFSFTGGTITETSTGSGLVVFNGTTTQTYTSGGTVSNTINFTVNSGAILQMAATGTVVSGAGTFTLSSGATLGITSANGIVAAVATLSGNIQTTTGRSFNVWANYTYNGTVGQNMGTGFPTNCRGILTINNPGNTVVLDNARTIANGGSINLTDGTFAAGTNLTMASTSTINRSGGSMTGTPQGAGAYNVNYIGNSKTTGPEMAGTGMYNVTINLTSGQTLTLDQNRFPDGDLTINGGIFNLSTYTIDRSLAGGNLALAAGAVLNIGGTNSFPSNYTFNTLNPTSTVEYYGTNQTVAVENYGNLTISGSGLKTLTGGNLSTVNGALLINSGPVLTLTPTSQLTVNGNTSLGGTNCLIIQSTSSGTGSFKDNGISGTGTAGVQRYLAAGQWHYFCIPMTTINAWTYLNLYMKYYREPLHHFRYVIASGSDSTLNSVGLGYAMYTYTNATVNQSGNLNTGNIFIPVSRTYDSGTSDFDGWNLVGNPYPSSYDLTSSMTGWANVDQAAWFWDPGAGNYMVYPASALPVPNPQGYGTHTANVPPEQGFFVHCNDPAATQSTPGSGTVNLINTARTHSSEPFLKNDAVIPDLLKIRAQSTANSYFDALTVYFDPARSNQYEPGFDALKLTGYSDAPQIYTLIHDTALSVNAMVFDQQNITVPMGFSISIPGTFTLIASNIESFQPDVTIQLEDLKSAIIQDLRSNPVYSFSHDPLNDPNRFLLHFGDLNLGVTNPGNVHPVQIYSFGNSIYINAMNGKTLTGEVYVYDLLGKELYHQSLPDLQMTRMNLNLTEGYYLVKVLSDQGVYTGKVYLN